MGTSKCSEQNNLYGRNQVQQFIVDLDMEFKIGDNDLQSPAFIKTYLFGITDVEIGLEKVTVTGNA